MRAFCFSVTKLSVVVTVFGGMSSARTHRGSVSPVGTAGFHHESWAIAGTVQGVDLMTRSGGPSFACSVQTFDSSFHCRGAGMSFGSPLGAPAAVHRRIVSIWL